MKIIGLPFDIAWENPTANILCIDQKMEGLEGDIIVLPEMWVTGFSMNAERVAQDMEGPAVQAMQRWATQKDALVLGSLAIKEGDDYFNRALAVFPTGEMKHYNKQHLFSYAQEGEHYTSGTTAEIFEYKGLRILMQVCYDLRFPESARCSQDRPLDLLVYMANWPARRSYAWQQLLIARAIENQAYCIGVNRVGLDGNGHYYDGRSMVIDYGGKVGDLAGAQGDVVTMELDLNALRKFRAQFPFLNDIV